MPEPLPPRGRDTIASMQALHAPGMPDAPFVTEPVASWLEQLKSRGGVDEGECGRMRSLLLTFCAVRGVSPAELLATWEEHPELTVRRRPDAVERREPAVESFLIHNGIKV